MRLFALNGRVGRRFFAAVVVLTWLPGYPMRIIVDLALHGIDPTYPLHHVPPALRDIAPSATVSTTMLCLAFALLLALVALNVGAIVRRLHDLSLTGWLILPAFVVASTVPDIEVEYLPPLATMILLIGLMVLPGSRSANRYGPPTDRPNYADLL